MNNEITELKVCLECRKIEVKGEWRTPPPCFNPKVGITITNTYCPDCTPASSNPWDQAFRLMDEMLAVVNEQAPFKAAERGFAWRMASVKRAIKESI